MAFFTPRGLKVRFPARYALALMARVSITPFKFLKTIETFELLPSFFSFVAIFVFIIVYPVSDSSIYLSVLLGCVVAATHLIIFFINRVIPRLLYPFVFFARVYSYAHGFGIYSVIVYGIVLVLYHFPGVIALLLAQLITKGIVTLVDLKWTKPHERAEGGEMFGPEMATLEAYKYYAKRFRISNSTDVVAAEYLDNGPWVFALNSLLQTWPEVAKRMMDDSLILDTMRKEQE